MDACTFEGTVAAIYSIHPFVMQCELDLVQDLEASLVRTNCGNRAGTLAVVCCVLERSGICEWMCCQFGRTVAIIFLLHTSAALMLQFGSMTAWSTGLQLGTTGVAEVKDTIRKVRELIQAKLGIPPHEQHLMFQGKPLDSSHTCFYYNMQRYSTLFLLNKVENSPTIPSTGDHHYIDLKRRLKAKSNKTRPHEPSNLKEWRVAEVFFKFKSQGGKTRIVSESSVRLLI